MDDLGPATSEWVVTDGAAVRRYSATPDDAQRALGGNDALEDHAVATHTPVAHGACTQVLLRKALDGSYQLLFNGCVSVAGDDGYHVLPSFRKTEHITESATGRKVPAPVVFSVLVEGGACAPDCITLQARQRTFVAGVQTNENRESVIMEAKLQAMRPGDVESKAVSVPYPMAFGPPPRVVFQDNAAAQKAAFQKSRADMESARRAWEAVLQGRNVSKGTIKELRRAMRQGFSLLPMAAWTVAAALQFKNLIYEITNKNEGRDFNDVVQDAMQSTGNPIASLMNNADIYLTFLKFAVSITRYTWQGGSESDVSTEAPKTVSISVFDLPGTLRRVAGAQSGGLYSNLGNAWNIDTLKKLKRFDDAAVLKYLLRREDLTDAEVETLRQRTVTQLTDQWRAELPQAQRDDDMPDDKQQEINEEVEKLVGQSEAIGNGFSTEYGTEVDMRNGGYVESVFSIEVVDSRRNGAETRETYRIRSEQSLRAGLVAAGYETLASDLSATETHLSFLSRSDFHTTPVLQQVVLLLTTEIDKKDNGSWKRELANWWAERDAPVYKLDLDKLEKALQGIVQNVKRMVQALVDGSNADTNGPERVMATSVMRYLPHLVRMRPVGPGTFELERDDEQVEIATAEDPATVNSDGLRDAVKVSSATLRIVRQAVVQFLEADGIARPRMRIQMLMKASAWNDQLTRGVKTLESHGHRRVGIATRHVYAPRMPIPIVDAMACREEHAHLRETSSPYARLRAQAMVAWLTPPEGEPFTKTIAGAFGLPASHAGELILGVVADVATNDVLERSPNKGQYVSPTRAQLMASAMDRATRRMRVAQLLADAVFKKKPMQVRLNDDDALFDCYPEGATLLTLLRESAVWRAWQTPSNRDLLRHDLHASASIAAPVGIVALEELLDAAGKLRPAEVPLHRLPFLAPQTLCMHTHEALAVLGTRNADSENVRNRALAALAVQVEHSYQAAQRLHAMATGLLLTPEHQAALLRDCARARPVLHHVPEGADLAALPENYAAAIRLVESSIAQLPQMMQPQGIPNEPRRRLDLAQPAHARVLKKRVAAMRFDVDDLSKERVFEDVDEEQLLEAFARLRFAQTVPAQYLVPFGAAVAKGSYPLMGCCFENLPVYVRLLAAVVPAVPAGTIVSRKAHDTSTQETLHPMVITTNGFYDATNPEVGVALVSMPRARLVARADPVPPTTLRGALRASEADSSDVDAASAFLFNVERLVQCVFLVAGLSSNCATLNAPPPPKRRAKRLNPPPPPPPPTSLRLNEMRTFALLVAMDVGDVDNSGYEWLKENIPTLGDDRDLGALLDVLDAHKDDVDLYATLSNKRWEIAPNNNRMLEVLNDYADSDTAVDEDNKAEKLFKYFDSVRHAADDAHDRLTTEHTDAWILVENANDERESAATEEYDWVLGIWPSLVVVANAVASGVLANAPVLVPDLSRVPAADVRQIARPLLGSLMNAVDGWNRQGLKAVPLCELVAVVVRADP